MTQWRYKAAKFMRVFVRTNISVLPYSLGLMVLKLSFCKFIFWFKYDLGDKYHTPQVQPDRGLNSWPPYHDSTFYKYACHCSNY